MFIWQIPRCGSPQWIADQAALCGFKYLVVKIADGVNDFGVINGVDQAQQLVSALHANGLEAWGWQYLYSFNPEREAAKAVERILETGVDGFVIDAEAQCKGRAAACAIYAGDLRAEMDELAVGLSSYRFPSLHPELPWKELRAICDFDMPQVYWCLAHNAGGQLRRSVSEFSGFERKLPLIPTGAAYREFGWEPTAAEVKDFMDTAVELGLAGFNFWEWYDANLVLPVEIWETITGYSPPVPPQGEYVQVNVEKLNIRSSSEVKVETLIGQTSMGKVWEVTGRVTDGQGRLWVRSGPTAHLAAWLCKDYP